MKHNYYYKIYNDDIINIINHDLNVKLVEFIKEIIYDENNHIRRFFLPPYTAFLVRCIVSGDRYYYGWMNEYEHNIGDNYGAKYFIDNGYVNGGEYLSMIRTRKLKLEEIEKK
jgi:hypothetical protein